MERPQTSILNCSGGKNIKQSLDNLSRETHTSCSQSFNKLAMYTLGKKDMESVEKIIWKAEDKVVLAQMNRDALTSQREKRMQTAANINRQIFM